MKKLRLLLSAFVLAAMIITSCGFKDSNEALSKTSHITTANPGNFIRTIFQSEGGISAVTSLSGGPAFRFTVSATNGIVASASSTSSNPVLPQVPIRVGDYRDGGVVFYVAPTPTDLNGDGTLDKGLVCAINDNRFPVGWWNGEMIYIGATATSVGMGQTNTTKIINKQGKPRQGGGNYAAFVCDNHLVTINGKNYSDWFLPSIDELELMIKNQSVLNNTAVKNGGSEFGYDYWSSSEVDRTNAEIQRFHGRYDYGRASSKYQSYRVRAVRAF